MTQCIDPTAIEEGDLLAYAEGEAKAAVQAHVRRCPHCRERAATLGRAARLLGAALRRASCPAPEKLAQYQLHLLSPGERLVVGRHLQDCPHCTTELIELARPEERAGPIERLRGAAREAGKRTRAVLVRGPILRPLGARGATVGQSLYRAGDLEIMTGFRPQPDRPARRILTGRLLHAGRPANDWAGRVVRLFRDEEGLGADTVDEIGYFTFYDVLPGRYRIVLMGEGQEVEVEVEVGRP